MNVSPLLTHHSLDSVLVVRNGVPIPCRQFLGQVLTVSQQLPDEKFVLNLCEDRYWFLVGFAAALLRKQVTLLPPGRSPKTLSAICRMYERCYGLSDETLPVEGLNLVDVRRWETESVSPGEFPSLPHEQIAVIAFTSGSTGAPRANPKTWGALVSVAKKTGLSLGISKLTSFSVVATVPPQHMYGLETSIMLPLQHGAILHAGRPFYPEDIRRDLLEVNEPRLLISTPIHLRACIAEKTNFPTLTAIVSATAPLEKTMAQKVEPLFQTSIFEIYGFAEAGTVALRRPLVCENWELLDGLNFIPLGDGHAISMPYFKDPVPVPDHIACFGPKQFVLLGRPSHLINIAGRRVSLDELNGQLQEIPGVEDGTFFMPDEHEAAGCVTRLVAFVVAPDKTNLEILNF